MIRTIKPEAANIRTNAGKAIQSSPVIIANDGYDPPVQRLRTNAGKAIQVASSQQVIEVIKPQLMRVGGKPRGSGSGGAIAAQTKTISYVADGNYRGVFYEIGTKLQTESYSNPSFFLNQFRVSFVFADLLSSNQSLSPHRLLERPANLASERNPFHTSNGGTTYITVSLPSGFRLKPTGFAMQSRTDFTGFHTTQVNILGCNNISDSSNGNTSLGTFNTGFTDGNVGQFYVNTSISTSSYFNSFRITRTANSGGGTYFTGNLFEFFGELKIYE